jgi:hypothetical protein
VSIRPHLTPTQDQRAPNLGPSRTPQGSWASPPGHLRPGTTKVPPAAGHPFTFITADSSTPRDARARATVPGEPSRVRGQRRGDGDGDPGWKRPSEEAGKSGEPGTGAGPAGLAQVGDPDATRACGVLSRASTARGTSAPAGPRSPLRHRPRAAASRDARAQATRPGEPAYPRAAATGLAGRRKGGLQLPAEDRAARTTLCSCRTGVRVSVPRRHRTGPTWSGTRAGSTPSHQDLRSLD